MKGSHLIAFLGGALTATAIALLFLTDEGANIRAKIVEKLEEKGIKLSKENIDELVKKVKEDMEGIKEMANEKVNRKKS